MDKPAAVRAHLFVKGRVQGVGFRWSTVEEARRVGGLTGWVRNLDDGRVEAVVEGPKDKVEALVRWAHRGPPSSRVDQVDLSWETPTGGFKAFGIE
ncbi:MAG TPA: acylphosphatase [Planctomycetota bacterium]|nr:acylphosphatase [Planctomycetota bacterium]